MHICYEENFYCRHETLKTLLFCYFFFLVKKSYFSVSQSTTGKTVSTNWQLTHFVNWFIFGNICNIWVKILTLIIYCLTCPCYHSVHVGGQGWWRPWGRPSQSSPTARYSSHQTWQLSDGRKLIFSPAGPAAPLEWKFSSQILKFWFDSTSIFRK